MDDDAEDIPQLFTLSRTGSPVRATSARQWDDWYSDLRNRRVAATSLGSGGFVSTIFLGMATDDGCLFQTVHFQSGTVIDITFYATRAEALIGHDAIVGNLRESHHA